MRTAPATPAHTLRGAQHSPAMEQQLEQLLQQLQLQLAEQQKQRDWASLPNDVLRICLSAAPLKGDAASSIAAFATCKAFARAVLHTSLLGVGWNMDRSRPVVRSAKLLEALWGAEEHKDQGARLLALSSTVHSSPGRCLAELLDAGVRLPFRQLNLEGLSLDALIPSGVGALLPNLTNLLIVRCQLTPAARTTALDAACGRLCDVQLKGISAQEGPGAATAAATAQLTQLAKLPSLSSITLGDSLCPTLFLLALGTQLTHLHLDGSYHQYLPNTLTPTPGWKATSQHVARCTRLQELTITCHTAEDLGLVAPALQQLRKLRLMSLPRAAVVALGVDGDAVMEVLLGLPHLTSLLWDSCAMISLQRRYTDSQQHPCRWEELIINIVSVRNLARLPLHSLKLPISCCGLVIGEGTSRREVQAAVANVTRNCPAGFQWQSGQHDMPGLLFFGTHTQQAVADALVAFKPLLAPLVRVMVGCDAMGVEVVKVLAQMLPRTCTCLQLANGIVSREVLEQVASSMRWLATLQFQSVLVKPLDVVQYVHIARSSTTGEGGAVRPVLGAIKVFKPPHFGGMEEVLLRRMWEEAVREVQRVSGGAVVLEVMW